MMLLRKWQRYLRWCIALAALFVLWQVIHHFSQINTLDLSLDRYGKKQPDHWGSTNEDIDWLPGLVKSRSQEIPIVVVEEHYEVLKYWFQAADLGLISKSRNVLIHVDGHVDGAVPYDTENIPWFHYPNSRQEIYNMMQRNDMFIVAAVLTGFVDHVIWVWPQWDRQNHDSDWSHVIIDVQMGYTKVKVDTEMTGYKNDLCSCWKIRELEESNREKTPQDSLWECHRRNFSEVEAEKGPQISKLDCMIHATAVLEVMSEAVATVELPKIYPASSSAGVILDIDEDFYGCWSDMIPLQKSGMAEKSVELLSDLIADVLCADTAREEVVADMFYTALVNMVINLKSESCEVIGQQLRDQNKHCKTSLEVSNYIIENIPTLLGYLKKEGHEILLCHEEEKLQGLYLQSMMQLLLNFSMKELRLLSDLGICFKVSPSSRYFAQGGLLHVCMGENTPARTKVSFHLPSEVEITTQTVSLRKIITAVFKKPDLVTICRSVRDGYTPKQFHQVIESNILTSISHIYRSAHVENAHYDTNLLGGRLGWAQRSRIWTEKLLKYVSLNRFNDLDE
ncbi:unnamed protein product [Lymnaea stagnalis]|uniref:Uncharacterized protein n=1 Tax=Lymnaea stagnalis TaxID=6523 RepID=A0AAV2I762_LYMST